MSTINKYITVIIGLVLIGAIYYWGDDIRIVIAYGWDDFPTHDAYAGCTWVQKTFSKSEVSFFLQDCRVPNIPWTYSEDAEGRIVRTSQDGRSLVTIQVFSKPNEQSPYDVVVEWYDKLTPEQKLVCEIVDANQPESQYGSEAPHKTPHKERYKISVKEHTVREILEKYEGLPGDPAYDYMCGNLVGSRFASSNPYFEFDDRTPDKYLFVGALGTDDSVLIDLNSMRF